MRVSVAVYSWDGVGCGLICGRSAIVIEGSIQ